MIWVSFFGGSYLVQAEDELIIAEKQPCRQRARKAQDRPSTASATSHILILFDRRTYVRYFQDASDEMVKQVQKLGYLYTFGLIIAPQREERQTWPCYDRSSNVCSFIGRA
jgi:hypothetical protein